jgi:succinate dehydrogenase / fumarate reductase, cytochrome b subunit
MQRLASLLGSSIGKKLVMAATGVLLFGYVASHVTGNLLVFLGPQAINDYGKFLHTVLHGTGIWIARAVLLAAVGLHIWAALSLTRENRAARPEDYRARRNRESTLSSRTMVFTGVLLAVFIVYHLAHFTTGHAHPQFVPGDVYHNMVSGFRPVVVSAFYVLSMLALGLHLYHGAWSMLQTLGASHPRWNGLRNRTAQVATIVIVAAFIAIPVAVLLGVLHERPATTVGLTLDAR